MIVNALETAGVPTSKGELAIDIKGKVHPFTASNNPYVQAEPSKDDVFTLINSLGNGSVKTFAINPYNMNIRTKRSGNNTADHVTFAFPSGSIVPSGVTGVVGGIVIQKMDKDKNITNNVKLIPFELATTLWSDVKTAVYALLSPLTTLGTLDAGNNKFTWVDEDMLITFIGDLSNIIPTATRGLKEIISGEDIIKLERELAPNMGSFNSMDQDYDFATSNYIADKSTQYDIITIETQAPAQRPLILGSQGFITTLHICVPVVNFNTVTTPLIKLFTYIKETGAKDGAWNTSITA